MTSYQDRQYIPPAPDALPTQLHPLIERLNELRVRWAAATDNANAARRAMREAPESYTRAVVEAAAAGKDILKVPDPRPTAARELELRELAEAGLHREVVGAWMKLWNAIAADHDMVMAHVDKPCDQATSKVAELERQLQEARGELAVALGNRRWVMGKTTPCDFDFARRHAGRPQPVADADSTTLTSLRKAEAKEAAVLLGQQQAQDRAKARAEEAAAAHAAAAEKRKARREAQRIT